MSCPDDTRSYDFGGALLGRLARTHPRAAFRMAATLGAVRHRITRRWPTTTEVQALFPGSTREGAETIAQGIAALNETNRVLVRCIIRTGMEPVRPLVSLGESLRSIARPSILGTFHVGALQAIGAALEQLGAPVLAFRTRRLYTPRESLTIVSTEGHEQSRAAALHRALVHLRSGGIVVLALDDVPGESIDTQCLGHDLKIAPGAFALSRWSGAPIIPIVGRWRHQTVVVDAGERVTSPQEASTWLENYLRESPSELTLGLLRKLLGES